MKPSVVMLHRWLSASGLRPTRLPAMMMLPLGVRKYSSNSWRHKVDFLSDAQKHLSLSINDLFSLHFGVNLLVGRGRLSALRGFHLGRNSHNNNRFFYLGHWSVARVENASHFTSLFGVKCTLVKLKGSFRLKNAAFLAVMSPAADSTTA